MSGSKIINEDHFESQPKSKNPQWWKPIEEALAGISLKGLEVKCPGCGEMGLVTSRWIKGPVLKPIYILHIEQAEVIRVCELSEEQSHNIRGEVPIFESDIKKLLECKKPFALFSGGKDSLATLVYLKNIAKKVDSDLTAIYVDTTAGLPENTEYVKEVCRYLGINLELVKPKVDYFTLAKRWGIPSFGFRWCCRELKIKPIAEYLDSIEEPKVVFDGIRAAESNVRKQYIPIWYHPTFKCLSVSAIFHWSDQQVMSFVNRNGIPKTLLHSIGTSTECWCGAYKTEADFRKLYKLNRNMFYRLVEVEDENKSGYTFIYKNGRRKSLRDLEIEILKEENRSD
jgi:3'-phosphoadenosine 5'-phosphosulfate sulfotransferase (PAPS reductase)/FAD synthetase